MIQFRGVVVQDLVLLHAGVRFLVCSARTSCDHGHVESLCGKSFAHIRRLTLHMSFIWKAI